ncbi:hypothetical protein [Pontibacter chitinilyticus]|uniref:hypothetical protein n=1 Tax=Pontibacter chitinilyticus TaxID=2674989 RepID=UPI003218E9BA
MKTCLQVLGAMLVILAFASCSDTEITPQEDAQQYSRFHGKYKIVRSTSSEAVDINRDGKASTDLLQEIGLLSDAELEIRIPLPAYNPDGVLPTFTQFWEQQFLSTANADTVINYATQGVVRYFTFSSVDSLQIVPDEQQVDAMLFPLPDVVTIQDSDQIKVVMHKQLFTSSGWKAVTITTLYKRYTMAT